jgi:hypothetical protein
VASSIGRLGDLVDFPEPQLSECVGAPAAARFRDRATTQRLRGARFPIVVDQRLIMPRRIYWFGT